MFKFLFGRRKKNKPEAEADQAVRTPLDVPEPRRNVPVRPGEVLFNPFGRFADAVKTTVQEMNQAESLRTESDIREALSSIGVVAFIGPSGTGKSTRALMVARENQIGFIIDDGLLIHGSNIIAGTSAKTAPTKMESVRQALFADPTRAANMRRALLEHLPATLMILGTSDGMLTKICTNLWLNQPAMLIRIEDVSTEEERLLAKQTRMSQGKHTIPVPSMEIKHDFSGYWTEPLLKLKRKLDRSSQDRSAAYIEGERTVVRPTFSTLGNYSISDDALAMLARRIVRQVAGVADLVDFRARKETHGTLFELNVSLYYGYNAQDVLMRVQRELSEGIERFTAINVLAVNVRATAVVHKRPAGVLPPS